MKRRGDRDGYSYEGGNLASGIRKVRPGGRIKFDSCWHSDPLLIPHVGEWVRVTATDAFINYYVIVYHYHGGFICNADNERFPG